MASSTDTAQMFKKFSKPAADQSRSPLMRLPAELKVKVYRNLLKRSESHDHKATMKLHILKHHESGPRSHYKVIRRFVAKQAPDRKFVGDFDLGAQILSVCQVLYNEATPILYNENMLSIELDACLSSNIVMRTGVTVWGQNLTLPQSELNSSNPIEFYLSDSYGGNAEALWVRNYWYVLNRFKQVEVHIKCDSPKVLHHFCCLLRPFLWHKEVRLGFDKNIASGCRRGNANISKILLALRCRTLKVNDHTIHPRYMKIVTGSSEVIDLRNTYVRFRSSIIKPIKDKLHFHMGPIFDKEIEALIRLSVTVLHHDKAGFCTEIQNSVSDIPTWLELKCTEMEVDHVKEVVDDLRARIPEILKVLDGAQKFIDEVM